MPSLNALQLLSHKPNCRCRFWRVMKAVICTTEEKKSVSVGANAVFSIQLLHDLSRNGDKATHGELCARDKSKNKKRQRICIERPTYLNQRGKKCFIKDQTLLSACSQSDFKPSGSPAVHFWGLQASHNTELKLIFSTHFRVSILTRVSFLQMLWSHQINSCSGYAWVAYIDHIFPVDYSLPNINMSTFNLYSTFYT